MKYLITGGTGFIGGRLVEKLLIDGKSEVTLVVRNYTNAARVSRFKNINMFKTELNNKNDINLLVMNHDFVIHLAYDSSSQKNNLEAVDNLAKACIKHKKRLIHISTISVYEPLPDNNLNEKSSSLPSGVRYADDKLQIENKVIEYIKNGLDTIILQPTIVYGPFSSPWTDRPANQILSGTVILPNEGSGECNAVYIDDVCQAILKACIKKDISGHRFLISGPESISWRTFFQAFEDILNTKSIKYMTYKEIVSTNRNPIKLLKIILGNPIKAVDWEPMKSFLKSMQYKLPSSFKARIKLLYQSYKKYSPRPIYIPNKEINKLYSSKCIVEIDKAKSMLDYKPKYDFKSGMDLTGKYLKWAFIKKI